MLIFKITRCNLAVVDFVITILYVLAIIFVSNICVLFINENEHTK